MYPPFTITSFATMIGNLYLYTYMLCHDHAVCNRDRKSVYIYICIYVVIVTPFTMRENIAYVRGYHFARICWLAYVLVILILLHAYQY